MLRTLRAAVVPLGYAILVPAGVIVAERFVHPLPQRVELGVPLYLVGSAATTLWFWQRRTRLRSIVVMLAALLTFVGGARILRPWPPARREVRELEMQGDVIIRSLNRFRDREARFPRSPSEAGFTLPDTRFGSWHYDSADNGASFRLYVGHYGNDGFVLYWSQGQARWVLDT